ATTARPPPVTAPAPPTVCVTVVAALRRTVAEPALTALGSEERRVGQARTMWLVKGATRLIVVVTPVAPAAQTSAATEPTVKEGVSRKRTKAPGAVSLAAKVATLLATSHRSTLPAATTARPPPVTAPAPPTVCVTVVAALRRTVAEPALTAL